MASGYCARCGDASGERHRCVPPFLPADTAAAHAALLRRMVTDPPAPTREALQQQISVLARVLSELHTRVQALESGVPISADNARLRAIVARYADVIGEDADGLLPGVPF